MAEDTSPIAQFLSDMRKTLEPDKPADVPTDAGDVQKQLADVRKSIEDLRALVEPVIKAMSPGDEGKDNAGPIAKAMGDMVADIGDLVKAVEAHSDRLAKIEGRKPVRKSIEGQDGDAPNGDGKQDVAKAAGDQLDAAFAAIASTPGTKMTLIG